MATSVPEVRAPFIGSLMVFEHIEKLKQEYTDKYVIVDESRPELRRFGGMTGTVRTVNMSGRALVEFDAYNNIGWYDIDVDFLKVIDEPLAKPEEKPAAKKATAKASPKAAPAKKAPVKPAAKGAGMSVQDMLAAARAGKSGGAAAPAKADPKSASVADVLAAARKDKPGGGAAAPVGKDPKSMSVADMLAAARSQDAGGGSSASAPAPAEASTPQAAPAAPAKDPKSMSVADMLAAARSQDSGGGAAPAPAAPAADDPKAGVRDLLEAGRRPKPGAAPPAGEADNLRLIKGIGPKIESLLHDAGITTFAQLAATPISRLTEILDASGSEQLKQIANEETWAEQAAAFASGVAPADAPAEEAAPVADESAAEEPAATGGDGPRKDITSVEDQIAYCRQVDGE